jgi:hypothetical protein
MLRYYNPNMLHQYNEMEETSENLSNSPNTHAIQQGRTQFNRRHPALACTHPITREGSRKIQTQPCPHFHMYSRSPFIRNGLALPVNLLRILPN